ncbi:MAG: hypothetical protein LBL01_01220, partial [Bifidobacteriaceae bacterium]|nr:hypothetical protein [Bifidobacteriaceae bacterium]
MVPQQPAKLVALALAAALAAVPITTAWASPPAGRQDSAPSPAAAPLALSPINTQDQAAVAQAYATEYVPAMATPVRAAANLATCDRGVRDPATQEATFATINYYRRMAGVAPVTENVDASNAGRRLALMILKERELSHTPSATWGCATNNGRFLGPKSNIALGSPLTSGAGAVQLYMEDRDASNNVRVGHRRWILSPPQGSLGSGAAASGTSGANALVWGSTDGSSNGVTWDAAQDPPFTQPMSVTWDTPDFVMWPPSGYFPHQLAGSSSGLKLPWSVSTGRWGAGFAGASVTVAKNGADVGAVTVLGRSGPGNSGTGDIGHISFVLPDAVLTRPADGAVDVYHVTITGISGSPTSLSYDVKVFRVRQVDIGTAFVVGSPRPGQSVQASVQPDPPDATLAYQWLIGGQPVTGATGAAYQPAVADVGRMLSVRVTGAKAGWYATTRTSGEYEVLKGYFVAPRAAVCLEPRVGQACAATASATPAPQSVTYQWRANGSAVGTGASYTPGPADKDKPLTVVATFKSPGYEDLAWESDPRWVEGLALTPGTPTISGTAAVGSRLTAVPGAWAPAGVAFAYQWLRNGNAISGAASAAYTLVAADANTSVSVRVTGSLAGYDAVSRVSAAVAVQAAALTPGTPSITGTGAAGSPLTAAPGVWAPAGVAFAYQWLRDGVAIAGAADAVYTPLTGDIGHSVAVRVTGSLAGYASASATSGAVLIGSGVVTLESVSLLSTPKVGVNVRADFRASPLDASGAYQWLLNGSAISGATGFQYQPVPGDAGKGLSVRVTATLDGYSPATATSPAVTVAPGDLKAGAPVLDPAVPRVGAAVGVTPGVWAPAGVSLAYQWLLDGYAVPGQTGSSYVPAVGDLDRALSVRLTGTLPGYAPAQQTTSAVPVGRGFMQPGAVTLSGSAQVGGTLTVDPGTWKPANAVLAYLWLRNGISFLETARNSYQLTAADSGQEISVEVSGSAPGYWSGHTVTMAVKVAPAVSPTPPPTSPPPTSPPPTSPPPPTTPPPTSPPPTTPPPTTPPSTTPPPTSPPPTSPPPTTPPPPTSPPPTSPPPTSPPASQQVGIGSASILGFALTGETLTATASGVTPSDASLAYQWLRAGQSISGATAKTYKLAAADQGKQVAVRVTASKTGWTAASKTSAAVVPGTPAPPSNCGLK